MEGCTIRNNAAIGGRGLDGSFYFDWWYGYKSTTAGSPGGDARGGGVYAGGTVTITNTLLAANTVQGGAGGNGTQLDVGSSGGAGGNGLGGGLYVAYGTVALQNVTLTLNVAQGGAGGNGYRSIYSYVAGAGGNGLGGGLYAGSLHAGSDSLSLHNVTFTSNVAQGGTGGVLGLAALKGGKKNALPPGPASLGMGGGLYIDAAAMIGLDAFTLSHFSGNKASTSNSDIAGLYSVIP